MSVVPVDVTSKLEVPPTEPVQEPPKVAVTPCEGLPVRYYFEGGLRRVYPYHYTYNTYCKERWRNRELIDIFTTEFRDREPGYYVRSLFTQPDQISAGSSKLTCYGFVNREKPLKAAMSR